MKHGGDITQACAQFGGNRGSWLDLSTGINPFAWPVPRDLPDALWQSLPTHDDEAALCDSARHAYRMPDGVDIVPTPGTQGLIQWLPRLAADGSVAIVAPTYSEHESSWSKAGHETIAIASLDDLPLRARHVVLVNPNNPDGRVVDHATIARVADIVAQRRGWLVIDEAFVDIDPDVTAMGLCTQYPVIIMRSFGKFYGLAGLRLGFAIASPVIARQIADAIGPWACSGPALVIGARALRDDVWAHQARAKLKQQADALHQVLKQSGLIPVGGTPLYQLVQHSDAWRIHTHLAHRQIWTRCFNWNRTLLRFGLPPDQAGLARLVDALAHWA